MCLSFDVVRWERNFLGQTTGDMLDTGFPVLHATSKMESGIWNILDLVVFPKQLNFASKASEPSILGTTSTSM